MLRKAALSETALSSNRLLEISVSRHFSSPLLEFHNVTRAKFYYTMSETGATSTSCTVLTPTSDDSVPDLLPTYVRPFIPEQVY